MLKTLLNYQLLVRQVTLLLKRPLPWPCPVKLLFGVFALVYAYYFWDSVRPYWFHPDWTTDDATQQSYHFHAVLEPGLFPDDIVNRAMEGYLAPLHYWISYGVTWLVGDVIMMGHWVMLIQVLAALGFLFFAVKHVAGVPTAFFSVAWLLHTRHVMQRLTGGLPRGWSAALLTGYLYLLLTGKHRGVLLLLLSGCLLNPPVTFLIGVSYGLFLSYRVALPSSRAEYLKPFATLLLLLPVYGVVTYSVIKRPAEIGSMITLEEAKETPELKRPGGRFPFVPLRSSRLEIKNFGFQAFVGRLYNPGRFWKANLWKIVTALTIVLFGLALLYRRSLPLAELFTFLLGIFSTYFASRYFAFRLYVPDRHLQFPMAIFFIVTLSCLVWCLLNQSGKGRLSDRYSCHETRISTSWLSVTGMVLLGWLIYTGSGTGLYGAANFNYSRHQRGHLLPWLANNTPVGSVVAGHPTLIDGAMLFGKRQGFITTETAHPFYDQYLLEVRRRLELVFRAHFARDFEQFLALLEPEGIDYFVFRREDFYPSRLKSPKYMYPWNQLLAELTSGDKFDFVFRKLPGAREGRRLGVVPFANDLSKVVDLKRLREYLAEQKVP